MAEHGSDTKQGPGWWIASDGRWYAPETHPDYRPPPPPPAAAPPVEMTATTGTTPAETSKPTTVSPTEEVSDTVAPVVNAQQAAAPSVLTPPAMNQNVVAAPGVVAPARPQVPQPAPQAIPPHQPLSQTAPPAQSPFASTEPPRHQSGATATTPRYEVGASPLPTAEPVRHSSVFSGLLAVAGGLVAIVSSFMVWAVEAGSLDGFDLTREVVAFDSNGAIVAGCGVGLVILGVLMLVGLGRQLLLAVLAILCGGAIIAAFVYSFVDITGSASDDWVDFVARGTGIPESVVRDGGVGLTPALGLWLSGLGGLLGALSAPFINRAAN